MRFDSPNEVNSSKYNWIYNGSLHGVDSQVLRHKGKRRKGDKRSQLSMGMPISEHPKEVAHRQVFGHWELDTMVSSRGCFETFVERKSRLYTALLIPDRTSVSMLTAISQLYRSLPKGVFKTGTTDRGKEFACYSKVYTELGYLSILPMTIPLGKGAATRTLMACFVSSILRKPTWLK